ncbi:MAG: hypothetical protein ACK5VQ_13090 [Gammaproteobacteria bacterium]|jgi:hypothetical protein
MRTPGFTALVHAALAMLVLSSAPASAKQWDMVAGSYHTHLIFHGDRFELHLHDKATHGIVDTSSGRYTATLLAGGKTTSLPLTASKSGILTGRPVPSGDWVLLFRVEAPGRTPVQVRYSSKMKPGTQPADTKAAETKPAAKEKAKGHDGHAHHDGH